MILNTQKSKIETSQTLDHQVATVSLNPVVMHILSRDLYQKHIESPFREILTNALDAHIEAGVYVPIEIHLPTAWDEVFYIRDFGAGLSHEAFMKIYLDYGNSTRRETNEVNGAFGLGTKSPLAYTSSFSVTSYHGGEQRDYIVYYNEDNIPCVDLLSIQPSVETGIKVQFTTKNGHDYLNFEHAAETLLSRIPEKLYVTNIEIARNNLSGKEIGPLVIRTGSTGINVVMGHVAYKVEEKTVLDYLSAKDTKININGEDILASNIIKNLTRNHCIDIISKIGEYPVHPSREYINITPRAIALLLKDLQTAVSFLFSSTELSLKDDIYRYVLTGTLPSITAELPVRAKFLPRNNSYRLHIPPQINNYKGLISVLARSTTQDYFVGKLSQFDYTDYIGSSRTYYRYPIDFPSSSCALLIDIEERTDPSVVALFDDYNTWDFTAAVEEYRVEKNKERDTQSDNGYSPYIPYTRTRRVTKSMQDPKHNILILEHGRFGSKKTDWRSGQYNVQSLKDLGKPIYWVQTRMGHLVETGGGCEREILEKLYKLKSFMFKKDIPVVIGLPASKGTKKIEAEFKPLSELGAKLDAFIDSPFVQRRLCIAELNQKLLNSPLHTHMLDTVKAYGHADWLLRLNRMCSCKSTITHVPSFKAIKQNFTFVEDRIKDMRVKFPDLFRSWGMSEVPQVDLQKWAQQVAEFTNCKPTGAKAKNVS